MTSKIKVTSFYCNPLVVGGGRERQTSECVMFLHFKSKQKSKSHSYLKKIDTGAKEKVLWWSDGWRDTRLQVGVPYKFKHTFRSYDLCV